MFNGKKISALASMAFLTVGLIFVGCMDQTSAPSADNGNDAQPVVMSVRVGLDPVNSLAKASLISLKALILQFPSKTHDPIRDTIPTSTTPAISGTSTSPQTISKDYTLKPLRTWKVIAKTW